MTDEQAFLALMARFKITPKKTEPKEMGGKTWTLEAHEGGVSGYSGFVCDWAFDTFGHFVSVGVWE